MPLVPLQRVKIRQIARIPEVVEVHDRFVKVQDPVENKIRADKARAACDQNQIMLQWLTLVCLEVAKLSNRILRAARDSFTLESVPKSAAYCIDITPETIG